MGRLVGIRFVFLTLVGLFLSLVCSPATAGVGNFCPIGPCNYSSPTIVNVYWDSSPAQWDADVGGAAMGETQAQIDAFTTALVRSSYFSQLTQYGVNSVSVLPSITVGACGTLPANVDAAINGIDALILCALTHPQVTSSNQVIINVFLPPQVINTGFCDPLPDGRHKAALHGASSTFASPLYTIIPTTGACLGGGSGLSASAVMMAALTHEIVEAATDPEPGALSGWKVVADGEIGDLCESTTPTPLVIGNAQQYWSNSANACVSGFSSMTAPAVTSSSVCGTGRDMRFVLNGTFGSPPWDLASNQFASQSLYLRATISSPSSTGSTTWAAGNVLGAPPDTVRFQRISWVPGGGPGGSDQITVSGFAGAYGTSNQIVKPGDTVTFTIENPVNGARTTASFAAPGVAAMNLTAVPDITAGETGGLTATAADSSGCPVENAQISFSSTAGVVPPPSTTGSLGFGTTTMKYPDVAGPVTVSVVSPVTASATTRVHPRLDSLVPPRGAASGGQTTVLSGLGFDSSTAVTLGGNAATVQSVTTDHRRVTLLTPPSTLAGGIGPVGVGATVHGVSAFGLQYDYLVPDVPVMEFLGGPGSGTTSHSCDSGRIRVSAYDASGALESTAISLSAGYAAFLSGKRPVRRVIAGSGSIVTILGGGPITAVNLRFPNAVATEGFPVWPQDLCDGVKIVNAKISHLAAIKAQQYRSSAPACNGDCGDTGVETVFWGDADEATKTRNLVWMQGRDADSLRKTYEVLGIQEDAQRALVTRNPVVAVRSKTADTASFVGPMIEIRSHAADEGPAHIPVPAHISFALPGAGALGTYAIVHLRLVGSRLAWVEETPSMADRHGSVVTTTAESTGVYGLVQLVPKAKRPARAPSPAKRRSQLEAAP